MCLTRLFDTHITMLALGLENLHCSLVIQRVRSKKQTSFIDNGFKKIFLEKMPKLYNEPKDNEYVITNIAGYHPTLPKNSIFNNISFYPSNWPDFNTLPLAGPVNTTNSTDISQNPETRRREVRIDTYDNTGSTMMEREDPKQRTEVMSEADIIRRKELLRTMPQLNNKHVDNVSSQYDLNEKKLRDAGVLLNNRIDYGQLSKLIKLPWSTLNTDNRESITVKEAQSLLEYFLLDETRQTDISSNDKRTDTLSNWNESRIMSSLIHSMDLVTLTRTHYITEEDIKTFAHEVKRIINKILQ